MGPSKESAEGDAEEDSWTLDCLLVSKSGKSFPASKVLLAAKSSAFKDILSKLSSTPVPDGGPVRVQLDDDDSEIQALVENLHHPERFLKSVIPELSKEGVQNIKALTVIGSKYRLRGVLRQVESCLSTRVVLEAFCARFGNGDLIDTWLFACRYGLRDVLLEIEDLVQSQPQKMKTAVTTISSRVRDLPPDAQSNAVASLVRMFQGSISTLATVASKCESVLSAVRKHRSEEPNCSPLPKYVEDYLEYPVRLLKKSKH